MVFLSLKGKEILMEYAAKSIEEGKEVYWGIKGDYN